MKKFNVRYRCSTMFLKWENVIEAHSEVEAYDLASKKGKVLEITEILEEQEDVIENNCE